MHILDYLILAAVAVWLAAVLISAIRRHRRTGCCSGCSCSSGCSCCGKKQK